MSAIPFCRLAIRVEAHVAHPLERFRGCSLDYTWIDQNRKQVRLPAPQYIDYVMTWVGGLLSDEATFPTKACKSSDLPFRSLFPASSN